MAQTIKVSQAATAQGIPVLTDAKFLQGFSPVVEVDEVAGGYRIAITDATHTETVFVANGESVTDEQVADAVTQYLSENPIEPGATAEESAQIARNTAEIETLTATKLDADALPENVSAFANDAGYLTAVPGEYVTESELSEKGYLTEHQSLAGYAKSADIPTKVSELTNDRGYITAVPSEYVTENELAAKGYLTKFTETDPTVPTWAKQPNKPSYTASEVGALPSTTVIPTVPKNVSAFANDAGYLTQHQDLSEYAKKSELPTVPDNVSAFTNDAGYLTAIPGEYVTDSELNAKGYLTEHQSLEEYAKKSELPTVPSNVSAFANDAGYAKDGDLAAVAKSGSYNDLSDKPSIPSNTETWTFTLEDGSTVTKAVYIA